MYLCRECVLLYDGRGSYVSAMVCTQIYVVKCVVMSQMCVVKCVVMSQICVVKCVVTSMFLPWSIVREHIL